VLVQAGAGVSYSLGHVVLDPGITMSGAFYVPDGTADPAEIAPSTGVVSYRLLTNPLRTGTGVGLLLVQMLADDRIRVETFAGSATAATFTAASLVYAR